MSYNCDNIIKKLELKLNSFELRVNFLEKENKQLKEENRKLKLDNKNIKKKNHKLKGKLKVYENSNTPSSKKRNKKQTLGPYKKSGRLKGHEGSGRPYLEPTVEEEFKEYECSHCFSSNIQIIDIEEIIQEEIPKPEPIKVIKNSIYKYICRCCKRRFEAKNNIFKNSRIGINLATEIVISKFEERLPLKKIKNRLLRRHNCYISESGLLGIIFRYAKFIKVIYNKLLSALFLMKFIYGDETGWRIKGQNHWLWSFSNKLISVFLLRKSRGRKPLDEILKNYMGIIISDGWKVYLGYCKKLQRCWAHLLREAKNDYSHILEGRAMIENLENLLISAKKSAKISSLDKRRNEYNNHIKQMKILIGICNSHKKLRKFAKTIKNGLNNWFTAIIEPEIDFTNNRAERELREPIILRKIMGGLKSKEGAEAFEVIMSLIMTFKKQGKDLHSSLANSLIKSQRTIGFSGW